MVLAGADERNPLQGGRQGSTGQRFRRSNLECNWIFKRNKNGTNGRQTRQTDLTYFVICNGR
jgi:hypothetical protein